MLLGILESMTAITGIMFLLGFILVVVEMFIPGFGVAGITGGILLILGIILIADNVYEAIVLAIIILAILAVALAIVLYFFTKGKMKKIVLSEKQDKNGGYIGTEDLNYFLGKEGVALTVLRPSGTADFDGVKLDVVSEGEFLDKGTAIRVLKVQGRRILVRAIK